MKKLFIIIGIVFVLGIIAWAVIADQVQYRSVAFDLKGDGYTVEVYKQDSADAISRVTKTSNQRFKEGEYYYKVVGDKLDDRKVTFTITTSGKDITVDPDYSPDYLARLASEAETDIQAILRNKYGSILDNYDSSTFRLYKKGEWGGGYLVQIVDPRQAPDIYRYVVHKQGDTWSLTAPPELSIGASKYPDIPIDVLRAINSDLPL
jgi:hypothetical protein